MRTSGSVFYLIALTAALGACGGSSDSAPPFVIPQVPVGAFEAGCQQLCALGAGETICTPKHSEFCVARCRAATRDLPQACGDCLIAGGSPILGTTDSFGDSCSAGEVGSLSSSSCRTVCDDAGAAPPSPDLDVLCQLECMFYTDDHTPFACSASAVGDDCLIPCQAAIAAQGRICAQCMIADNVGHGEICFNNSCECLNSLSSSTFGCETLCDTMPPQ